MAFTKYLNEIFGTVLVLSALLSTASAVDCHGKSFHCVNSTHFMICVDLGGGVSQSIDNFYISCPPPTVCQGTNHFECEFPAPTTPSTTLTNLISETTPPWDEVVTDTLPPGNTTKEFSEKYMNTESVTTAVEDSFTTIATVDYTTATTPELHVNNELNTVDDITNVQEIATQTLNKNKNVTKLDPIATAKDLTTFATDIVTQNATETIPVVGKINASTVVEIVTESIVDSVNITDIEHTVTTDVPTILSDMITQNVIETHKTMVKVPIIVEKTTNKDTKKNIEINWVPTAAETTIFTTEMIAEFATESTIPAETVPSQPEYIATTTDKFLELQTVDLNTPPPPLITNHTLREPWAGNTTGAIENITPFNITNITTIDRASTPNDLNETTTDILQVVVPDQSTSTSEPTLAVPHIKVDSINSISVNISRSKNGTPNHEGWKEGTIFGGSITSEPTIATTELPYPDIAQNGASPFSISDNIPPQNSVTTKKYLEVQTTTTDASIYSYITESQTASFDEAFFDHTTVNIINNMLEPQNPLETLLVDGALPEGTVKVDNSAAAGNPKTMPKESFARDTNENLATKESIMPTSQTEYPSVITSESIYVSSSANRDKPVWTTFDDTLVTEPTLFTTKNIRSEINSAASINDLTSISASDLEETSTQLPDYNVLSNAKQEPAGVSTDTYNVPKTNIIEYNFETEQTTDSGYIITTSTQFSHSTDHLNIYQNTNQMQDHNSTSWSETEKTRNGIDTFEAPITDKILNSSKESSARQDNSITSEDKVITPESSNINKVVSNVPETTNEGNILLLPAYPQNIETVTVPDSVFQTTNQNAIGQQGKIVVETESYATTSDILYSPTTTSVAEPQNVFIGANAAGDQNLHSNSENKNVSPINDNVDNIIIGETVTYQPALVDNVHVLPETVGAQTITEMHTINEDVTSSKSDISTATAPSTDLRPSTGNADITSQSYKAGAAVKDLAANTVNNPTYYTETGANDRVSNVITERAVVGPISNFPSGIADETNDFIKVHTSGGLTIPIVEGSTINFQPGVTEDVKPYTDAYFVIDSQSEVTDTTSGISTVPIAREPTFNDQTGASDLSNDVAKPYTAGYLSINSKSGVTDAASNNKKDVTTEEVPVFNAQPGVIDTSNSVTKPYTGGDLLLNSGLGVTATGVTTVPRNRESTLNDHTGVDETFTNNIKPYSDGDISIHSQSGAAGTARDNIIDTLVKDPVYNGQPGVTDRSTIVGNIYTTEGITIDSQSRVGDIASVVNTLPANGGSTLNAQTDSRNKLNDMQNAPGVGDLTIDSQLGVIATDGDSTTVSTDGKPVFNIQRVTERSTETANVYTVEDVTVKSQSIVGDAVGVMNALLVQGRSTFNTPTGVTEKSIGLTKVYKARDITFNLQLGGTSETPDSITLSIIGKSSFNAETGDAEKSIVTPNVSAVQDHTIQSRSEVADVGSVIKAFPAAGGSTYDTRSIVADSFNDATKPYRAKDLTTNSPSEVTGVGSASITVSIVGRPIVNTHTGVTEKSFVNANVHTVPDQLDVIDVLPVHESSTLNIQTVVADSSSGVTKPYRTEDLTTNAQVGVTGAASDRKPTFNTQTEVTDRSVTVNVNIAEGLSTKSHSVVGDAGSVVKPLSTHESFTVNSPSGVSDRAIDVTYKVEDATKKSQSGVPNAAIDITTTPTGSRPAFKTQNITQGSSVVTTDNTALGGTVISQSEVNGVARDITRVPVAQGTDYNSQIGVNGIVKVSKIHTTGDQSINTQSGITGGIGTSTSPVVEKSTLNSRMSVRDTTSSVVTKAKTEIINEARNIKTVNITSAITDNAPLAIDTKAKKIGGPAIGTQSRVIEPILYVKPEKAGKSTNQWNSSNSGVISRKFNSTITKVSSVSQNTSLNIKRVPQNLPATINVQREQSQQSKSIATVTVPSTTQTPKATTLKPNQATTKQPINNNRGQQTRNLTSSATSYTCVNKIRGRYSDKNDCRKFYICVGSYQPIVGYCPENTVFSDLKKLCTKNMSHCIRENQFKCPSAGRFSDFLNDNVYYICVNHRNHLYRFKFQCQKGYILNKTTVKCIETREIESNESASISDNSAQSSSSDSISSTSSTSGSSSISSAQSGSSDSTSRNSQSSSSDNSSSKSSKSKSKESPEKPEEKEEKEEDDVFKCEKEGKFPVRNDCRRYYLCKKNEKSEYRRKIKKCESGEIFHKKKRKCVDDDSYEC